MLNGTNSVQSCGRAGQDHKGWELDTGILGQGGTDAGHGGG